VLKNAQLYTWWKEGRYQSYDDQTLFDLSMNILRAMPYYVRINRFIRDIPTTIIESGNPYSNLRQMLEAKMAKNGEYCKDIRAREARGQSVNPDEVEMFIQKYDASGGTEYFLSFESKDRRTLYAFLRLRLNESFNHYIPELRGAALVREIHTYGQLVPIDTTDTSKVQHVGFGKRLLAKAEEIAAQHHATRVAVISGVGVREYYRKRGYHLEGTYMVKDLISNLFE
jgi:elongator complex protein 3